MGERLYKLVQLLLTPVAFVFSLFAMAGMSTLQKQLNHGEVKDLLKAYVDGTVDKATWSKFTLFRLENRQLDDIRYKAARLAYPAREGDVAVAKHLLRDLEAMN